MRNRCGRGNGEVWQWYGVEWVSGGGGGGGRVQGKCKCVQKVVGSRMVVVRGRDEQRVWSCGGSMLVAESIDGVNGCDDGWQWAQRDYRETAVNDGVDRAGGMQHWGGFIEHLSAG